jgi:hypothetical protein
MLVQNPVPKNANHHTLSAINDFLASPRSSMASNTHLLHLPHQPGRLRKTLHGAYFAEICCGLTRSFPLRRFPALIRMVELGSRFQGHGTTFWLMSGDGIWSSVVVGFGLAYLRSWSVQGIAEPLVGS